LHEVNAGEQDPVKIEKCGKWEYSIAGMLGRREEFVAPGEGGGFAEGGGYGAILFFGELDGVLDGGFVEITAEAVEDLELDPDGGRLRGAFAGADDFEGFKLLALLLKDGDDIGPGASAEGEEEKLHRAGSGVGRAVGVHGNGVAGRTDGEEFFGADPLDGGGLHGELLRKREE
jgi:hypothetical protein